MAYNNGAYNYQAQRNVEGEISITECKFKHNEESMNGTWLGCKEDEI